MSNLGNKATMAKNIKKYMIENGVTATDVCNTLGFPMPTFSDWIREKTYPRIDKIEKMANYFGIQKSDLIEEQPTTTKDDELLKALKSNPTKLMLAEWICQLNQEQLQMVEGILQAVIGKSAE